MTRLYVCPLDHLEDTLRESEARHLISLAGPGKSIDRPRLASGGFLALEFNDISEERNGLIAPSSRDVEAIMSAVDEWRDAPAIVFQCWMGISRSTAAALIASLTLYPKIDPNIAADQLREVAPSATPNALMIAHADTLLEVEGRLIAGVERIGRGEDAYLGTPFHLEITDSSNSHKLSGAA